MEEAKEHLHIRQEHAHYVGILRKATRQLWQDLETRYFNPDLEKQIGIFPLWHRINEEKMRAHLYHLLLMNGLFPSEIAFEYTIPQKVIGYKLAKRNRRDDLCLGINDVFVELKVAKAISLYPHWTGREKRFVQELKKQLTDLDQIASAYVGWAVFIMLLFNAQDIPKWLHDFCESHKIELLYHCLSLRKR